VNASLADAIDALLPQTQCTKCGYDGCRPYAEALAANEADLDQCPPGGAEGIDRLARLLGRPPKPLNPAHGVEAPRAAAVIDERRCIGCMLCIRACPTDAIVGAAKRMHTVLTEACSGCELCLPPCPVDCIDMVPLDQLEAAGNAHAAALRRVGTMQAADRFRERYEFRKQRVAREASDRAARLAGKALSKLQALEAAPPGDAQVERKKAIVRAAIERARARRADKPN
jgi:electron transport complex protein RnfB